MRFRKQIILFLLLSVVSSNIYAMSDSYKKVLEQVKSSFDTGNSLYDVVSKREKKYEELHTHYSEYNSKQIRYFLLNQKFEFNLLDGLFISGKGVLFDLYLEQAKNGFDIANATFLTEYAITAEAIKTSYKVVGNLSKVDDIIGQGKTFVAIVDLLISLPDIWSDTTQTPEKIKSLMLKLVTHPNELTADEFDVINKFFTNAIKILSTITETKKISNISKAAGFVTALSKLDCDKQSFKNYKEIRDNLLQNKGFGSEGEFLTPYEMYYLKEYYETILYKNIIVDYLNIIPIISDAFHAKNLANIEKAAMVGVKFALGLPGIVPTFNQNFATYAQNSITLYQKDYIDFINPTVMETFAANMKTFHNLLYGYIKGNAYNTINLTKLKDLWNTLGDGNFVNYIIARFNNTQTPWFENIIYPIDVKDQTSIELPYLGDIINTDTIDNLYLEVWAKDGTIMKQDLAARDVSFGVEDGHNVVLVGGNKSNNILIPIDKTKAFYDKNGGFYYYKFGIFRKADNHIIYSFIPQNSGGFAPGWDYTKSNVLNLDANDGIVINDNFGVLAFNFNKTKYKNQKKLLKIARLLHINPDDIKYQDFAVLRLNLNRAANQELQNYYREKFAIPLIYSKRYLTKDSYTYKDIYSIVMYIIKYKRDMLYNKADLNTQESKLYQKLNKIVGRYDYILGSPIASKYSEAEIEANTLNRFGVVTHNKNTINLADSVKKINFYIKMNQLYRFLQN